ncbi:hypothetical protein [Agrobacterium bohemicum]|uniref:Uncharacterized protein n=1 Tax=Agrobacterium bohemicum TaxID=2052828 RepID=A0A135P817_9HYPH|nr:hypothetical protein [Agrobacterium bohemicum]KXG87563.1 hypothetical protein ATO67_18100 [Agrobacterium bohemicum]
MGSSINRARRGLFKLMMRLPSRRDELRILWPQDDPFVALCEAYDDATDTLERLVVRPLPGEFGLVAEYQAVCRDLETDVEQRCRAARLQPRSETPGSDT